jgi:hypothetical protein
MKAFIRSAVVAVLICAFASVAALAGDKDKISKRITFATDTIVNGTVVKAGDYELKFDKQTNQLTIVRGSKVFATTSAEIKQRDTKAYATAVRTINKGNASELVGVSFNGSLQDLVVTGSNGQATGN